MRNIDLETLDLSRVGPAEFAEQLGIDLEAEKITHRRSDDAKEAGLYTLIERRDKQRRKAEGERDREALWKASVKRHHERRRQQARWEWIRYFDQMAANHAALAAKVMQRERGADGLRLDADPPEQILARGRRAPESPARSAGTRHRPPASELQATSRHADRRGREARSRADTQRARVAGLVDTGRATNDR